LAYGIDPVRPLDLVPKLMGKKATADASKRVEEVHKLHKQVKEKNEEV